MSDLTKFAAAIMVFSLLVLAMPVLGVLMGMFSGWAVGLFFEDMVMGFLRRAGVDTTGFALWQVGGAMGFLGGFLKTSVSNGKSKE